MSRSSRGSCCGLVWFQTLSILTYISGENGIVANSSSYLFRGLSPKLGFALAPYILLKKRLDLEAPAATAVGESSGGFRSRVRKTHSLNLLADSRLLLRLERLVVSIDRQRYSAPLQLITLDDGQKPTLTLSRLWLPASRQRYPAVV
jgi:hypothetical protein